MSGGFHCDRCGLCCRKVGKFPSMKEFDRGDGACKHLKDDNTCAIYETRPTICNVDRLYEERFKDDMTRDEWYRLNNEGCRELKEENGNGNGRKRL